MTPETLTAAEWRKLLVERTKLCPSCALVKQRYGLPPWRDSGCSECNGTGQVATFPMLRRECPNCKGIGVFTFVIGDGDASGNAHEEDEPCGICQGRGWAVAEVHLEDLLRLLASMGYCPALRYASGEGDTRGWHSFLGGWPGFHANDPTVSILSSVVAAVQAQEEKNG